MATAKKVKVTIELEEDTSKLLSLMAKKAKVDVDLIIGRFARYWISDNTDLLTQKELDAFKHLFYNAE